MRKHEHCQNFDIDSIDSLSLSVWLYACTCLRDKDSKSIESTSNSENAFAISSLARDEIFSYGKILEQVKLPAKLPDYFLCSGKSNISQPHLYLLKQIQNRATVRLPPNDAESAKITLIQV